MRRSSALCAVFAATLWLCAVDAREPALSVDDIQPGMVGVGRTVFEGREVQEFRAHILGVLRNVMGPSRNLILARLEGGPLAETGVIAGMSGSPVYVDGRLIGAVSYSLGTFSREPLAGITPIAEMVDATSTSAPRPGSARARLDLPVASASLAATLRDVLGRTARFAQSPSDLEFRGALGGPLAAQELGAMLRPIATPLVLGGFGGDIRDVIAGAFGASGFHPMAGTAGGADDGADAGGRRLAPGDAVGVGLITGDLALGATGTVTDVVENRVYAFGHPFYNLGPTQFPMTKAYIHTLLPSLMSSSKIGSLGAVVGTVEQDRATAIAGTLGPGPSMLPIRLTLETDRGGRRNFEFEVVRDQLFTPLLTYLSVVNTLRSYEREFGTSSFMVRGRASTAQHGEVSFEDLFTGDSPSVVAAAYVASPITFLLTNEFEPVEISELDLTIASYEEPRTATLERVWLDDPEPRAGRTVDLKALVRTYRGDDVVHTVPVPIPVNASGPLSIVVADGSSLVQWEQRELRRPRQAHGVAQMVRAFNEARKNNRLYVRLVGRDPGAVVGGEPLTALPPSILAVYEGDRQGSSVTPIRSATLGEWAIATDYAVSGARILTLSLDAN
jgi:hypothetical protein